MKSPEQVEEAEVTERDAQFLYADDEAYHFMDTETFEQFEIQREGMEDRGRYMREGDSYTLQFFEGRAIDIEIPYKLVYEVVESPEAVRGDTVSGATKTVTLETGLQVKVPIFIKTGDKVRVNTESGEYVERVND
jgi:elongation factor P